MKRCPECRRDYYDDTLLYCLEDGNALVQGSVPSPDEPATAILSEPGAVATGFPASESPTRVQSHSARPVAKPLGRFGSRKGLLLMSGIAVFLLVAGFLAYRYTLTDSKQIESIAILPFENGTGDPNMNYLSDGLSENLIDKLSQLPQLKVIARTSSFKYRGANLDMQDIANKLGVQALVVGRVTKVGDSLAVRVELIDAAANRQVWSEQFDRKLSDVLSVQRDIAEAASRNLRSQLTAPQQREISKTGTNNQVAYDLWLRARYLISTTKTRRDWLKIMEVLEEAISNDQNFALGYAELSQVCLTISKQGDVEPKGYFQKAEMSARKAQELDDTLAQAHVALAVLNIDRWDWSGAEREFKRSIELNPNLADAHSGYSYFLAITGRHDEAIVEARRARELDPLTRDTLVAARFLNARRFDEAAAEANNLLRANPTNPAAHGVLSGVYEGKGMYAECLVEVRKALESGGDGGIGERLWLAGVTARAGDRKTAHEMLSKLQSDKVFTSNYWLAWFETGMDDKDAAFRYLEKSFEEREPHMARIKFEIGLTRLHGDPRFEDLVRRMNFPE